MDTGFTFPLALYKAQWRSWLYALEMFETIGSRTLQDCVVLTRAEADAVMRAEDWQAIAMVPMRAFQRPETAGVGRAPPAAAAATQARTVAAQPSRRAVVNEALRALRGVPGQAG
jgi:hypothetical protein